MTEKYINTRKWSCCLIRYFPRIYHSPSTIRI